MKRLKGKIEQVTKHENGKFKSGFKAYSKGFGIGFLVGTGLCIATRVNSVSIILLFSLVFGAIGYQLKMRNDERSR